MRRPHVLRASGAALLVGAAVAWVALGTPGLGASTFGRPPEASPPPHAPHDARPDAVDGPASDGPATAGADAAANRSDTPAPQAAPTAPTEDRTAGPDDEVAPPSFTTTAPRGAVDRTTWPAAVAVPRLNVSAPVLAVGQSTAGELIVPHSPMDVGWYQGGSVPGEPGVALLTSHVDTRTEGRGVFAGLVELAAGDTVTITTTDGTEQRWTVTARTQHHKSELPRELFARSGPPVLALVTCGGPFDREARSYRDNVIVWAEPAA